MSVPHQLPLAFKPWPRQRMGAARVCSALCEQLQLQWASLSPAPSFLPGHTAVFVPTGRPRTSPWGKTGSVVLLTSRMWNRGLCVLPRARAAVVGAQHPAHILALQPSGHDFCKQIY